MFITATNLVKFFSIMKLVYTKLHNQMKTKAVNNFKLYLSTLVSLNASTENTWRQIESY